MTYYIAVDRLTFPCIDSGEAKMIFLLDPPP